MDGVQTIVLGARPHDPGDEARVLADVESALFARPAAPPKVGRYTLLRPLGSGAFGAVYEALDPELERRVAVKLVAGTKGSRGDPDARMVREAKLLAQLSHPNVVAVYDVGTTEIDPGRDVASGRQIYIVMELVQGVTLRRWLAGARRDRGRILDVFLDAARGLAAAHDKGIVHRDFKPDNVLVGDDGSARVSDFGLARVAEGTPSVSTAVESSQPAIEDVSVTATGTIVGTPAYMAPEQHDGHVGDARSDQYAFCVALWEALTGERPFRGDVQGLAAAKRTMTEPPAHAAVPRWLARIIARGLSVDPMRRNRDMHAVAHAIARGRGRSRRLALAGGALVLLSVSTAAWIVDSPRCTTPEGAAQDVWSDAHRERLANVFEAVPVGAASWGTVSEALEEWAVRFGDARVAACEAATSREAGRAGAAARSLACLDRQRRRFSTLTALLETGEPAVLEQAAVAVGKLPALEPCALEGTVAFPADDTETSQGEIEREVLTAEGLIATGQHERAIAVLDAVLETTPPAGSASQRARVHLARAVARRWRGDYGGAAEDVAAGLVDAERAGDPAIAVDIALEHVEIVGYWQKRADAGGVLLEQARARAVGVGLQETAMPALLRLEGLLAKDRADYAEARALFQRARAIMLERSGPLHPRSIDLENLIAVTYEWDGDTARAHAGYEQVYARAIEAYGPEHPETGALLKNLAWSQIQIGHRKEGVANLERAADILSRTAGPATQMRADVLGMLAIAVRADPARCDEALGYDRQVLELRERYRPSGHRDIGLAHLAIARTAIACDQFRRALDEVARARAVLEHAPGTESSLIHCDLLEGWAHRELGEPQRAIELHRRAIASEDAEPSGNRMRAAFASYLLGQDYLAAERTDLAADTFADALRRYEALGTVGPEIAQVQLAAARLAVHSEPSRARELAAAARTGFANDPDRVREIDDLSRELGAR